MMDKKALLLLAFASIVVSCQQAIETDFGPAPDIMATVEADPATKTQLSVDWEGAGVISWMSADKINVFFGKTGAQYTSQNTLNAATAVFRTSDNIGIEAISSTNIWGLYPYNSSATCNGSAVTTTLPAAQAGVPETFDDDLYITLAHSTSTSLQFFNVCSGIKFSLSRDDIKSVTFRGNNNENLAGDISLTFENSRPKATVLKGVKEITLTPKSGDTFEKGVNYYIVTLPVTLSKGFTITFTTIDGSVGTFTYTDKSVTLERAVFSRKSQLDTYATFIDDSHEPVDLGLSVMWATCNVGASSPEEYGDYFAWGETETKSDYSWDTYLWCNGSSKYLTKYNTNAEYGTVDNKTVLELSDDAARVNWGGKWRMPTWEEWEELRDYCTWTWTTQNGVNGYRVTSKKNSNSIFLPAAGYRYGTTLYRAGSDGYYRSSTLGTDYPESAYSVYFNSSNVYRNNDRRSDGQSVRPVYGEFIEVSSISLDKSSVSINVGESISLTSTVKPDNATAKTVTWSSSNESVAFVSMDGSILGLSVGMAVITAWTSDGEKSASCTVTVQEPATGMENGYEWVNLGLSVKWASCNVGASSPEEYGDYFAWGETEPKDDYSWGTYQWCNYGTSNTLTKYNIRTYTGIVDNKTQLDLSDDAARANWGGNWRMPTHSEWTELLYNCTWTWTTQNGVIGHLVTSKINGNSIFFPAAGIRDNTSLYDAGSFGYYWSSTLYTDFSGNAFDVLFSSNDPYRGGRMRRAGLSVRPVYGEFVEVSSISLDNPSASLVVGESLTLTATINPDNATAKDVFWSSSDSDVASVSDGVVTAATAGTATVTAYASNGLSASCTVTVSNPIVSVTGVTLNETSLSMTVGETQTLTATVTPADATNKAVSWSSNNTSVATVSSSGVVTAKAAGSATITVTTNDGGKKATCSVTVSQPDSHEWVDLGLPSGLKWATCNVGASTPEGYGDYFAWGETSTKNDYSWSTYKWCNGSSTSLTKYNTKTDYGTVDNKTQLDLSDDAARANWGGKWRMPTDAEWTELRNNCTWTWTTQNGVNGRKVTSKVNGNSIFLPAAGYRLGATLYNAGSYGDYWSSTLYTAYRAYYVYFRSDDVGRNDYGRNYGQSVRPVTE